MYSDKLQRYLVLSLLCLIIWVPLPLGSNRDWAWPLSLILISIQSLCLIWIYFSKEQSLPFDRIKKASWLLAPIFIFQVWVALQTIPMPIAWLEVLSPIAFSAYVDAGVENAPLSVDVYSTTLSLIKGIGFLLLVINCVLLINTKRRIRLVLIALVISGTLQAFYGVVSNLTLDGYSLMFGIEETNAVTGSFVYKNHLANYLLLCLPMGVALIVADLQSSRSGNWSVRMQRWAGAVLSPKMYVRLALIIMVIALVMTRSRMGNSAFFVSTIIAGGAAFLFYRNKPQALSVLILSLFIIDIIVIGSIFGLEQVQTRLVETNLTQETRDQVVIWSLPLLKDFLWTGSGMGTFYTVFPSYTLAPIGYYDHAHNEYLQFAIEAGVPFTLLLSLPCIVAMYLCVLMMKTRNSHTLKALGFGCLMSIIGMLIHISVDFNLQPPANAMTFVIILTLVACGRNIPTGTR